MTGTLCDVQSRGCSSERNRDPFGHQPVGRRRGARGAGHSTGTVHLRACFVAAMCRPVVAEDRTVR
eukprot:15468651-Alexandrium_andersonii.AAC.1